MASAGDISGNNTKKSLCLLVSGTTVNPPTLATDGYPVLPDDKAQAGPTGAAYMSICAKESTVHIKGTVTAGQTLAGTVTLWGYVKGPNAWFEIPVNGGTELTATALAETETDAIKHQERLANLGHYDRIAASLASVSGTGAAFEVWITTGAESN